MSRGPWERRKTKQYHQGSDWDKVQWACGIPSRFWNIKPAFINPSAFQYEAKEGRERTPANLQIEYLNERQTNPELLTANRLAVFTSHPSDEHGLAAACLLARGLAAKQWEGHEQIKVRVDDIQDYEHAMRLRVPFYSGEPDMLLLYNLNENTPRDRLSLVRDILLNHEGSYRGVVAACENPLKFAREFLHIEPQEFYHFEGRPQKVISR
jgi:hypothetical protein